MAGEDVGDPEPSSSSPNQDEAGEVENTTEGEPDFQALIQALDPDESDDRDDWALERECEIARLEKENEELRRLLKIDPSSLEANGIKVDEESVARYGSHLMMANRKRSGSGTGSASGSGGMGINISGEGFPQRSAAAPGFMIGDGNGNGNGNGNQQQPQQQQQQQQQQLGGGAPLQRAMELVPGMRIQGRRAAMFPRGGGGRGGNSGPHLWLQQHPPPPMPERPWQQGSNLDLK
jgi:hypothetical protein